MTNENLEKRTASRRNTLKSIIINVNEFSKNIDKASASIKVIYSQNQALYVQNKIIIDYLQEIYKNQSEVKK